MTPHDVVMLATARAHARNGTARAIRHRAGVSIQTVASAIGSSVPVLSRWERGERMPRGPQAVRWAALLADLDQATRRAAAASR
jgi:DNA-binding transcriptional regulator YiaG